MTDHDEEINKWIIKWADADAQVTRLTEALAPFANFNTEDFPDAMRAFEDDPSLTMGHFRAARVALTPRCGKLHPSNSPPTQSEDTP